MKPGDIISTTHVTVVFPKTTLHYSSGKKDYFVFICLGTEPRDGSNPLDPIKRLNELGWRRELNEQKE